MPVKYRFNSLEDFLISTTFTVDRQLDDGWERHSRLRAERLQRLFCFLTSLGSRRNTRGWIRLDIGLCQPIFRLGHC